MPEYDHLDRRPYRRSPSREPVKHALRLPQTNLSFRHPHDTAPRGYYLTGVFVVPDQRRSGIGAALTQARLDRISEHAATAWFFANARNTASIELHRRFGFEEVSPRFSFPGLTFEGGEGILFRLQIDQRT